MNREQFPNGKVALGDIVIEYYPVGEENGIKLTTRIAGEVTEIEDLPECEFLYSGDHCGFSDLLKPFFNDGHRTFWAREHVDHCANWNTHKSWSEIQEARKRAESLGRFEQEEM